MKKTVSEFGERDLLRSLKRAKTVLGDKFSRDNYRTLEAEGFPKEYEIRKHFGTWTKAVQTMETMHPEFVADEQKQILLYLNKARMILGESFKRDYYRLLKGFPTEYKIVTAFGSWTAAINHLNSKFPA